MQVKMTGTITGMAYGSDDKGEQVIHMDVGMDGDVVESPSPSSKRASGRMELNVKPIIAKAIRFGQRLYITISTDEP